MVISTKHNPYHGPSASPQQPSHWESVNDITFLSIRISAKLSWNIHIDVVCKKARQIIGLIHRNFHLAPEHLRPHPVHNPGASNPGVQLRYMAPSQQDLNQPFRVRPAVCLPGHTAVLELGTWWSSFPHIPSHPRSSSWLLNSGSGLQNSCRSLFSSQCLYSSHSFRFKTLPFTCALHPF